MRSKKKTVVARGRAGMGNQPYKVRVGMGTCGIAAGASKTYDAILPILQEQGIEPIKTGCMGMCYKEPLVEVISADGKSYLYGNVGPKEAETIVREHILGNNPVKELLVL